MATLDQRVDARPGPPRRPRHVFHSWSAQGQIDPLPVAGGEGAWFWDYDGNRYLDFASQLMNVNIGHQHPKLVAAIQEQAARLCTIAPERGQRQAQRARAPAQRDRSGRPRHGVLHERRGRGERERDPHGAAAHGAPQGARHLALLPRCDERGDHDDRGPAALAVGAGHGRRRALRRPVRVPLVVRRPHRGRGGAERALAHLEEVVTYEGAHTIAAVILEPIVGTNGILVPPDGYLQGVRELCDRHGIVMICDEVMSGFGRTGSWFASGLWDVTPDLITCAKGINSGYVPLGAVLISQRIADTFWTGSTRAA